MVYASFLKCICFVNKNSVIMIYLFIGLVIFLAYKIHFDILPQLLKLEKQINSFMDVKHTSKCNTDEDIKHKEIRDNVNDVLKKKNNDKKEINNININNVSKTVEKKIDKSMKETSYDSDKLQEDSILVEEITSVGNTQDDLSDTSVPSKGTPEIITLDIN